MSSATARLARQPASRRHRLLAGGLLLTLLLSVYAVVLDPWLQSRGGRLDQLADVRERIGRYENIIAEGPALRREINRLEQRSGSTQAEFFDQPTRALALAELQRKIKLFASARGARLMSTQPLNRDAGGEQQRIAVTVSLQGDLAAVHGVLLDLRQSTPALFTEALTIVSRAGGRAAAPRGRPQSAAQLGKQMLNVTMTFSAFWQGAE